LYISGTRALDVKEGDRLIRINENYPAETHPGGAGSSVRRDEHIIVDW